MCIFYVILSDKGLKPSKPRVKQISLISSFAQQHFNKPKSEPKAKAHVQKLIFQKMIQCPAFDQHSDILTFFKLKDQSKVLIYNDNSERFMAK